MIGNPGDNCIVLCRVSDPGDVNKGDSFEDQEERARQTARENQWNEPERVFEEPLSSLKGVRPVIEEIVGYVKSSPEPIHHLVVRDLDRFSRAGTLDYLELKRRMAELGVNIVDSRGIIQPERNTLDHLGLEYEWSKYSPSEAAEILAAITANQELRNMLTRMVAKQALLVRDGYKVRQPADGFLNKKIVVNERERVIEVPDPDRADYYRDMFRLRASGRMTDKEIVNRINADGFKTRGFKRWDKTKTRVIGHSQPKPLTVKHFQEIIERPIYCGVRVEKLTLGEPVRTQYPGLISIKTFNQANRGKVKIEEKVDGSLAIHYGVRHAPVRLKNNPLYPYKNVVHCPECPDKPFLGSASRGRLGTRYPAYHCNRGHYLRIPKAAFEESVDGYLEGLHLDPEQIDEVEKALRRAWKQRSHDIRAQQKKRKEHITTLKTEQDAAVSSLIAVKEPIAREKIEARVKALEEQIKKAQGGLPQEVPTDDFEAFVAWARDVMEHPLKWLKDSTYIERQRALFECIFERPPTYEELVNGTPKIRELFGLIRLFAMAKSDCVRSLRFEWNTVQPVLKQWLRDRGLLEQRAAVHQRRAA